MVTICCILFPFHHPSSQVLLTRSPLKDTTVMTSKSSKSNYTNSFFSKWYLCNTLKLSVDGFSLTFGQSPKELIFLYNKKQNVNVINLENVQIMTKRDKVIWALLFRRAEWQVHNLWGRGAGSWCFRESVHHHSNQWNMIKEFRGKSQEGREERLQRSKEQNQPETMKKHALHWGYNVAETQPKRVPRTHTTLSFASKYFRNHKNECG